MNKICLLIIEVKTNLKQLFQSWSQSSIPAIDNHGQVLGDYGWLDTILQLQVGGYGDVDSLSGGSHTVQ